ncbi:MAG: Unknown protein [uncultured Thiotrichaceae bacterium]|uniref:Uncharacterized protein n=1 Tax=uncultured Thiotrichaceae bacterium TaxID=298394 RepID=A0A6S6SBT1_9GAMM|nr:MAG: Unknown protein [uncultured Thiotrichaceae bacterium]
MSDSAEIRKQNLLSILNKDYKAQRTALADRLDISSGGLNKYIGNGKTRPMSDRTARLFERRLGLEFQALDTVAHADNVNFYYIRIVFEGHSVNEFLRKLHKFSIIQEASAQYGETDIFIKIKSTEAQFQKLVFDHLRAFPGVSTTITSQALSSARWQRKQEGHNNIPGSEDSTETYLNSFLQSKSRELYKQIAQLDKGEHIIVGLDDMETIRYQDLLSESTREVLVTKWVFENDIDAFEDNIAKYSRLVDDQVTLKLLVIYDDSLPAKMQQQLQAYLEKYTRYTNQTTLSLVHSQWVNSNFDRGCEWFTIFDGHLVSIREKSFIKLHYSKTMLDHYQKVFQKNWNKALRIQES